MTSFGDSVISKRVLGDDIQPSDNSQRRRVVADDNRGRFGCPRPLPLDRSTHSYTSQWGGGPPPITTNAA